MFLQAAEDMRQKAELIQQIKAMESVPIIRTKFLDTTETGGQGLLSEMSLAEVWWHDGVDLMVTRYGVHYIGEGV